MIEADIIRDVGIAESVWKQLVRPANLYDEWAIRINFLDSSEFELHLLTDNRETPGAMLPLQRKIADGSLGFIGSPFLERNRGFVSPGSDAVLARLYASLPGSAALDDISADDPVCAQPGFVPSDPAYILERAAVGYENRDSLYQYLPKNIRENLRKIGRKISSGEIAVTDSELDYALDRIRFLQHARFGSDSWLESPFIYQAFSSLKRISDSVNGSLSCILMQAGNEAVAACISVFYRNTCYMLMEGVNNRDSFSGLGSYLHFHCMAQAFDLGCDRIDTGIGDCGWKERWKLGAVPQFRFETSK